MTGNPRYQIYVLAYGPHGSEPAKQQQLAAAVQRVPGWAKYFEATWLLATQESARKVWERLEPYIGPYDYVLIAEVGPQHYGRLPKQAWEWFESIAKLNEGKTRGER